MAVNRYHLTCTQAGWFKDKKTYYNVPAHKVWDGLRYMSKEFNAPVVFVYESKKGVDIGSNPYVGSYSAKWDNFKDTSRVLHKTYRF